MAPTSRDLDRGRVLPLRWAVPRAEIQFQSGFSLTEPCEGQPGQTGVCAGVLPAVQDVAARRPRRTAPLQGLVLGAY